MRTIIVGFIVRPTVLSACWKLEKPQPSQVRQRRRLLTAEVCSPPQTEVSWTCIATGVDPGSHGVFDFVHRDPATYVPYVSLLPTRTTAVGEQFLRPYTTKTLFEEASDMGYPATAMWWPALFPARPEVPVETIPGLGTPDIRGQLGVGTLLTTDPKRKDSVLKLEPAGRPPSGTARRSADQNQGRPQPMLQSVRMDVLDEVSA
jgi:hypothetical protein